MNNDIEISVPNGYEFSEVQDGKIIFKRVIKLPKTVDEYLVMMKDRPAPTLKEQESLLSLMLLLQLRDVYRQGWKPDWTNDEELKYSVVVERGRPVAWEETTMQRILSFQSVDILDEFMHNFENLIENVKDLL